MSELDLDEFLQYEPSAGGGKKFLQDWKSTDDHSIKVWLHPQCSIVALWRHQFPDIVAVEDKDTGEKSKDVWGRQYKCLEEEATLQKQNFRDKETGEREYPPERCPFCKLIEHVYARVRDEEISWTEPVFKFEGSDPTKKRIIHAAGMYNGFAKKDKTAEEKRELKSAKIFLNETFKENMKAKLNYVFGIVAHDHPEKGVQITTESQLLGDKIKKTILKERKSRGIEDGDIRKNPYCLLWEYNDKEGIPFDEKYDATALLGVKMTPDVRKALEADPPDMASLLQPPSWRSIRARMERHCLIKGVPWDEIFSDVDLDAEPATREEATEEDEAEEKPRKSSEIRQARDTRIAKDNERKKKEPEPEEEESDEEFGCNRCGEAMKASDMKCGACGVEYDSEGHMIEEKPQPAQRRSRSEVKAGSSAPKPKKSSPKVADEDEDAPF